MSLLALLAPGVVGADCSLVDSTVTCEQPGTGGFDAGGLDGLQVDVLATTPGTTVDNGGTPGVNALNLNDENVVDVQAGVEGESEDALITASGLGSSGIAAINDNIITNAGSISVTGDGGSGISGADHNEIGNTGTIETSGAGGIGISVLDHNFVSNDASIAASGDGGKGIEGRSYNTLFNDGTITAAEANSIALEADSNDNDVRNGPNGEITLGTVDVGADDSVGILVGNDNYAALNQGSITAYGDRVTGIEAGDGTTYVQNNGTLSITGDDGTGIAVGDGNGVWNYGTIIVAGSDGRGIEVGDDNTLRNSGSVTASGTDGIGVLLGTDAVTAGNALTNSGTITGGSGGSGVAVSFAPSGSGTSNSLDNQAAGEIDGTNSGTAILGSAGVEEITNWGTITGSVQLGAGNDVFTLRNQGTVTGDVDLGGGDDVFSLWTGGVPGPAVDAGADSDTLRLEGAGTDTLDLSILSDFEVLDVASDGTWELSGSGSFLEGATVTSGTLALDGEVNLSGDFVQGEGTSLLVRVYPDSPDPDDRNDRLVVNGNATIADGAMLQLLPTAPLTDAATYTFLTTISGTVSDMFDVTNFPADTAVLSYSQVKTDTSLSVEVSRLPYASAAATGNQTATAIHLDEILAAGPEADSDMATVLVSLDMLATPELQAALDELHPEAYDAQSSAALSFGRSVGELAAFRRPRCEEFVYERRPEIVAPPPCSEGWMLWGSGFGLLAKRDGASGHIDFSHLGGGLLLGADHPLGEHFLVYGFLGGGYTTLDVDGVGDGTLFNATVGAGGRWSLGGGRIHALLGYARGWHKQDRKIDFGEDPLRISRKAKGDYGSNLLLAFVKAGYTFRIANLDLEPLATVEYGYLMEESFEESGADDLALDVDKRSNSLLSTTVGARLAYSFFKWEYHGDFLEWADGIWTPEVTARWRNNWTGTERDLDARLAGAPDGVSGFTVEGQDAEKGLQVGAGVAFRPLRRLMSIRFGYDGFYGDGSMIHRLGASIRVPLGGPAG